MEMRRIRFRSLLTRKIRFRILVLCVAGALLAPQLLAQNPTGSLTGRVVDTDGGGLPGVTVTANSAAVQGTRSTITGANGDYKLAFLPPGLYRVIYGLEGFKTAVREVKVSAAQTTPSNITLELGEIAEEIVVTSQQALISETGTSSSTTTFEELEQLPVLRDISEVVRLAPGVANSGFRDTAPSISGGPTYENLWMINGIVINENIRATVLNLFIEDAIQETTTSVSGISAEYGRFTGGVVNAITKSGGNQFEGSLRVNVTNEDWESKTPLSGERVDEVNEVFEATLGGYFWKDRLWFFGAGRDRSLSDSAQTDITNTTYPTTDEETRIEGKLTISPNDSHSIIGSYFDLDLTRTNTDFGDILDLRSLNPSRGDPQEIKSVNYTGILNDSFFVEGQWSERDFIIGQGSGGPTDLIDGTLIRTRGEDFRYWAPTFCGTCEDELRDNENILVKGSYFVSSDSYGSHDLVFGYDTFDDIRSVINHQTGSDFTVYGTDVVRDAAGNIVLDPATGSPFPVFDPDNGSPWIRWFAVFNEDLAQPTSFKTNSFYVNDSWQFNDKWSFNIGVRFDENDGVDSSGTTVADDSKISPRLAASYDVKGNGDLVLRGSYGSYVAGLANGVADDASPGGAIGSLRYNYLGAPINVGCTPGVDCLSADTVLRQIFAWYEANGGVFDLADFDPDSPFNQRPFRNNFDIPGGSTQIVGGIESPSVEELTFGFSKRLGSRGLVRADVVLRDWEDFYGERTNLDTGQTADGIDDVTLLGNFNTGIEREYRGLISQLRYRASDKLTFNINYTLSNTEGNFLGETRNSGPVATSAESYPQYREARWNYPTGDIRVDQRHTLRAWAIYDLISNERHRLSVSWLENYFSGQPYGANRTIDPSDFVDNPGFLDPPTSVTYFFTDRDAFHTDNIHRSDISLNYSFALNAWNRQIEFFVQPEVLNVFGEDGVIDPQGLDDNEGLTLLDSFNPFTETPVEGVHWERSATFGMALNEDDFQDPRTFRLSVGFRF